MQVSHAAEARRCTKTTSKLPKAYLTGVSILGGPGRVLEGGCGETMLLEVLKKKCGLDQIVHTLTQLAWRCIAVTGRQALSTSLLKWE